MKVTILQTDIVWGKPSENQTHAEKMIQQAKGSDMYILPEMWNTGFNTCSKDFAEQEEESIAQGSVAWMRHTAMTNEAAVCGSIAIKTASEQCFNRTYFAFPDGTLEHYDKRHLFSPGGEDKFFSKGNERKIVEYKGYRFMLLVCYDLRFPIWSRCNNDYDVIIYVANWPSPRQDVWTTLLKARAIENQCYVIGVNRTGNDVCCQYEGGSIIFDAYGKIVADCKNESCVTTAELDLKKQNTFRNKFAVLNDRDSFQY